MNKRTRCDAHPIILNYNMPFGLPFKRRLIGARNTRKSLLPRSPDGSVVVCVGSAQRAFFSSEKHPSADIRIICGYPPYYTDTAHKLLP